MTRRLTYPPGCVECKAPVRRGDGYRLESRANGQAWWLCSLACLAAFVRGGGTA